MDEEEDSTITLITWDDLKEPERLERVRVSVRSLYYTIDWSPEFYVALAREGFIATSLEWDDGDGDPLRLLLPELQNAYAVLDWEKLHASRSMLRWMRSHDEKYELRVGCDFAEVLEGVRRCHGEINWMEGDYVGLLGELAGRQWDGFELMPVGLTDETGALVAGEIGYRCGRIYTSLTGFSDRTLRNVGKLQLLKLGAYLRDGGFAFWNLGHPQMQYKLDLGAVVLERPEFLRRWDSGLEID